MSREIPSQFIPFQMLRRSSEGWKPTIRLLSLLVLRCTHKSETVHSSEFKRKFYPSLTLTPLAPLGETPRPQWLPLERGGNCISSFPPFQGGIKGGSSTWVYTVALLVGGWLVLIPDLTPAQAQIHNSNVLLAQEFGETLPPPPVIPFGEQPSPQLQPVQEYQFEQDFQPSQPVQNNQLEQNFQPSQPLQNNQFDPNFQPSQPEQFSQYNENFERYLVYVDGSDFQTLQEIRRIEPTAYIRQYQGRNVIQAGVFNRVSNAQQRVGELQSRGIYSARIISFANGQEINAGNRGFVGDRNPISSNRPVSRYYVAIPATPEQLPAIAAQIRQNLARFSQDLGRSGGVLERTQPRGPHVAIGPFSDRFQAEEWNKFLRNTGYRNARVYYGK